MFATRGAMACIRPLANRIVPAMRTNNRNARGYVDTYFLLMAGIATAVVLLLVGIIGSSIYVATHHHERTNCHVTGKDRTSDSHGNSNMRVYTDNCGNFKVQDSMINGNFHSSDTYAEITIGKTYDFDTTGYRIPFFSQFPNILSATEVAK